MPAPRKYKAPALGDRFGRGIVTGYAHFKRSASRKHWDRGAVLACDCGREYLVAIDGLWNGRGKSCGCGYRQRGIVATPGYVKHPLYATWHAMVARCQNEDHPGYENWGGRGIRVHPAWTGPNGLRNFITYVDEYLGPKPAQGRHTLDRRDNDGNYEPGNLRWASWSEQMRNRRPPERWRSG